MSSPLPGTSPCTAATVISPSESNCHGTSAGTASSATRPTRQAAPDPAAPLPRHRPGDDPGQQRAQQGEQEADADRAGVRQRLGDRGVDDPEGEPSPRHPAQRPAAAPHLDGGPRRGEPQRPEPVALQERRERAQHGVEQRLQGGQRDPGGHADRAHPEDVGEVERRTEDQADHEGAAQAQPAGGDHEAGHRHRDQPGDRDRLEGQRERQPRYSREDGAPEHPTKLPKRRMRADSAEGRRGPAALRSSPVRDRLPVRAVV